MKKTQFKTDIHQIFLLTKRNFSDWDKNPRIWMTFALGFVLCLMLTNQILEQAQTFQTPVQMFEPLIWTFGDAQSVMLSSLLLLLLFADMPFVNQMTPYWLIRTKRSVWMASQILYVILSTCLYTVFLCLTELLIASPWAYVGNVWSQTAASIGYGSNNHLTVPVSIKTMEMTTPYKCAICVVFLMSDKLRSEKDIKNRFGLKILAVLNLQKGRAGGVVGALLINLYGILLTPDIFQKVFHLGGGLSYRANILCGWLSPLNHATFPMHNFGYDNLPSLKETFLIFGSILTILVFLSTRQMKRYNFPFSQVDES